MNFNNQELENLDLNYLKLSNDPLLQKEGLFYDKTKINIYKMLIRLEDFKTNNKGQFYKKIPFILDPDNKILNLLNKSPKEYQNNNYINLRKLICRYQSSTHLRADTLRSFIKKKCYPLTFLRVVSKLINEEEFHKIIENSYISDFSRFNKIKLITDVNELPDFLFYLFGIILGDGTINEERIKIVDGDGRKDKLKFSKEFLERIKKKIEETFRTRVPSVRKIKDKNCYELIFHNKWLCYFLNFLLGLEFKEKINPKIQRKLIFKSYQKNLVIRGLFDTDGSLDKHRVTFATKYKSLLTEIIESLERGGVDNFSVKKTDKNRKNPIHKLTINSKGVLKYAKLIGFSHPRKSSEIKQYILSNSRDRVIKSIKEKELYEIGYFLRPIANEKLKITPNFFRLDNEKKIELIKLFNNRFGCDFERLIRKNRCINNRKITRLFTEIFKYEPERKAVSIQIANRLYINWLKMWD